VALRPRGSLPLGTVGSGLHRLAVAGSSRLRRRCDESITIVGLIAFLIVVILLLSGGGYYAGGPYFHIGGAVGLVLLILVLVLLFR
jgi:hypothetical protein